MLAPLVVPRSAAPVLELFRALKKADPLRENGSAVELQRSAAAPVWFEDFQCFSLKTIGTTGLTRSSLFSALQCTDAGGQGISLKVHVPLNTTERRPSAPAHYLMKRYTAGR
jgi:hypothetical protein